MYNRAWDWQPSNLRRYKKHEIKALGGHAAIAAYNAYNLGEYHAIAGMKKRNPYPAGVRHDNYERGYDVDLMGQHHGRNI